MRINPHEIHILDPEYIDTLYAGGSTRRDKYKWIARMLTGKSTMEQVLWDTFLVIHCQAIRLWQQLSHTICTKCEEHR